VSHLQKRIKIKLLKIINALKTNGPLHIRGLAKITGMHPATVSSIISRLGYFFDTETLEVVPGFKAKIIRLKNTDITIEDFVNIHVKIKSTNH
jgi:DNA-binding Lrp family transcriptional regulator